MPISIIDRVRALRLPEGEYVIIGSGLLDALDIRRAQDIDIAVTPKLFEILRAQGGWEEEERWGKKFLEGVGVRKGVTIAAQLNWEAYTTPVDEAIRTAEVIEGIAFLNKKETIKFKTAMGRSKDLADIELLEKVT